VLKPRHCPDSLMARALPTGYFPAAAPPWCYELLRALATHVGELHDHRPTAPALMKEDSNSGTAVYVQAVGVKPAKGGAGAATRMG